MNPFMMMFAPMGFGFMGGGCCCGVNMPYYGMDDRLTFMNFPVFRNTSMDYLLDPRLAMMQAQQSYYYGGNLFGNTMLPMFSNFPGMNFPGSNLPGLNTPWNPWGPQRTETKEEKEKREAKEAEAKKPEAKKAANLKKTFDKIKKLTESNAKGMGIKLDESIITKANEAMKKETAEEQLEAMKEVMAEIPDEVIRKSVMADEYVAKKLKEAGYNFNYKNNKYSIPSDGIVDNMNDVRADIISKTESARIGNLAAHVASGTTPILAAISTWNNTQNEKGILNFIADNFPSAAMLGQYKAIIDQLTKSLLDEADEYSDCPKIKQERDKVEELKDKFMKDVSNTSEANYDNTVNALKSDLKALSKAFESLYARLRMQEAATISNYINSREEFTALNEVKENVINKDMVVAETYANLKEEGIDNVPSVNELDEAETTTVVTIGANGVEDADKKYEGNPQGLVDEYLAKNNKYLSKVKDTDVYQTKDYDGKGSGVRYFSVQDDKLVEVKKKEDDTFVVSEDAEAVTAKEIEEYDSTVKRINKLLSKDKSIVPVKNTTNLFKATGAEEYYALVDGKFGKVKTTVNNIKESELTVDDLEDFNDSEVKSKEKVETAKKEEENKDIKTVASKTYSTYASIDNDALNELSKEVSGKEDDFEETAVSGYYHCKSKNRYYVYNQETGKLDYLEGVTKISETGHMIKDGKWLPCTEIINTEKHAAGSDELKGAIQDYAKAFAKDLNGVTNEKEYIDAKRRLNTFTTFTDPEYIINFIKGYKAYGGFWMNSGMCKQIATEYGFKEGTTHTDKESKRYYIKWIAIRMKEVVNKINFSKRSDEYKILEQIARGELIEDTSCNDSGFGLGEKTLQDHIRNTAEILDRIIDKMIEAYDEKHN